MPHCGWRIREKFPRRPWCPEILKPPLTCAVVRERPRLFALTLLVAESTLVLSSFVRIGGPREIQSTRENWRPTVTSQSIGVFSRLHISGQECICAKRFVLHEKIADEFL